MNTILYTEVERFVRQHYKHERLFGRTAQTGWDDDYGKDIVTKYQQGLNEFSAQNAAQIISRHESVSGESLLFTRCDVIKFNIALLDKSQLIAHAQSLLTNIEQSRKQQAGGRSHRSGLALLLYRFRLVRLRLKVMHDFQIQRFTQSHREGMSR